MSSSFIGIENYAEYIIVFFLLQRFFFVAINYELQKKKK